MSDYANEQTGNYIPPSPPKDGDDGYVAPGPSDIPKEKDTIPAPEPRINASVIRNDIQAACDLVAGWCDWNRDLFAKELVKYALGKWGEFNWVICHSAHSYIWMGARGVAWEHWHYELDVWGAGTIGYELYWAKDGVFNLVGDGGFINWAYGGTFDKLDDRTLYFHAH